MGSIGRYDVDDSVVAGRAPHVRAGRDEHGRPVTIAPLLTGDPAVVEQWRSYVAALATLEHPHLARVHEVVAAPGGGAAIVSDWVTGPDLATLLAGGAVLTPEQATGIVREVLTGLAAAHARGVVSANISPTTVVVDAAGVAPVVRLVDVGLAGALGGAAQAYVAPEVLMGHPATARSDVYSVAALWAHLLRGAPVLPPTADGLEPPLADVVAAGLATDPQARPADAADLLGRLERAAEQRHGPGWTLRAGLPLAVAGGAGAGLGFGLAGGGAAAAAGGGGAVGGGLGAVGGVGGAGAAGGGAGAAGAAGGGVAMGGGSAATAAVAPATAPAAAAHAAAPAAAAGAPSGAGQVAATHGAGQGMAPDAAHGIGEVLGHGAGEGVGQAVGQAGGHSAAQSAGHGAAGLSKAAVAKIGAGALVVAGGVGVAAVVVTDDPETRSVELSATANIYLSGQPDPGDDPMTDAGTAPFEIDLSDAETVAFLDVSGDLAACTGCEPEPVDGGSEIFPSTNLTALNGIAGVVHEERSLFLVGVFLGEGAAEQTGTVDLTDADTIRTQRPEIGEPFFIGDGETGDGEQQEVVVPPGATRLYLGFADGYAFAGAPSAYADNSGTVDLEVQID